MENNIRITAALSECCHNVRIEWRTVRGQVRVMGSVGRGKVPIEKEGQEIVFLCCQGGGEGT